MTAKSLPPGDWHATGRERLPGLPRAEQGPVTRLFLHITRRAAGSTEDLNVFRVLARLGAIFPRYLLFLSQILTKGRISRIDKERIILRVAWRVGCVYEWGHHVSMAKKLGIADKEILSLAEPASDLWDNRLRVLVRAVDELVEQGVLGDNAWQSLSAELDQNQLVEFCMLVGHYIMVAMTINSCGVALEPGYLEETGSVSGDGSCTIDP